MSRPEYSQWSHALQATSTGAATPLNLAASVGNYVLYAVTQPISLNRIQFLVTTATTSGSVAGVVGFYRFPTYASSSGSVLLGTLTIPTATAVGKVVYKDLLGSAGSLTLNAGEQLCVTIKTQQVDSGTAAGAGYVGFGFEPAPASVGDQTNMLATT